MQNEFVLRQQRPSAFGIRCTLGTSVTRWAWWVLCSGVAVGCFVSPLAHRTLAADWTASRSTFTHDPMSGERVRQFAPIGPVYHFPQASAGRSSYRHVRSTIQAGNSADNMHFVERSGAPVRPYGEWRFPYRPGSVPSALWAPPYFGAFAPYGPVGAGWDGFSAGGAFGAAPWGNPYARQHPAARSRRGQRGAVPSWEDGRYPPFEDRRLPDSLFFDRPPFDASRPAPHRRDHRRDPAPDRHPRDRR